MKDFLDIAIIDKTDCLKEACLQLGYLRGLDCEIQNCRNITALTFPVIV